MATAFEVRNALAVVALTFAATAILVRLFTFLWNSVWEPLRLRRIMAKQGVTGPPFRFLFGNLPEAMAYGQSFPDSLPLDSYANFSPTVTPQYALYFPKYGKRFLYGWGSEMHLTVREPEFVKELFSVKFGSFKKSPIEEYIVSFIVGKGLTHWFGEKWALERRTLNPFFHQEALKGMVETMVKGAASEIKNWEQLVDQAGGILELDVEPDIHTISSKVLSYTAFGGDFERGKQIYELQKEYIDLIIQALRSPLFWIPGFRLLPTRRNRRMAQLDSKIATLLHKLINDRRKTVQKGMTSSYGDDLLGCMLAAASDGVDEELQEFNLASVFNNCKLFFFAGQDTVANTISFMLMLLARYPEWQDRARKEVLDVIGEKEVFDSSKLSRLKIVGMVINEAMRLFPVTPSQTRAATEDMQLGDLFIPKGLCIEVALGAMYQDPALWGEDVAVFNPERFTNGTSKACKHPQAFVPFSYGPKICIGMNYAINEAKIVLSMILSRFQLLPSPHYKHHPMRTLVQAPKFGIPIILKTL